MLTTSRKLNELNELNDLSAPNDSIRDVCFPNRENASCFPKNIFAAPIQKTNQLVSGGLPCVLAPHAVGEGEGPTRNPQFETRDRGGVVSVVFLRWQIASFRKA